MAVPLLLTLPTILMVFIAIMWFGFSEAGALVAVMAVVTPYRRGEHVRGHEGDGQVADRHGGDLQGIAGVAGPQGLFAAADAVYFFRLPLCLWQTWKIVALAETFGLKYGIGYMFFFWFGQFDITQMLAWIMMFVVLMLILEHAVFARLETRAFAWRPAPAR